MNNLTQIDLYNKAKAVYTEITTLEEDLLQLIKDYSYAKEENETGLEKNTVKTTLKAAEVYVRNNVEKTEEKIAKEQEFLEPYRTLSGEYE